MDPPSYFNIFECLLMDHVLDENPLKIDLFPLVICEARSKDSVWQGANRRLELSGMEPGSLAEVYDCLCGHNSASMRRTSSLRLKGPLLRKVIHSALASRCYRSEMRLSAPDRR